jgi:hypothetical protein
VERVAANRAAFESFSRRVIHNFINIIAEFKFI